jgi:hypothetical protein
MPSGYRRLQGTRMTQIKRIFYKNLCLSHIIRVIRVLIIGLP